jgi:hypothetical protein
VTDTNIPQVDGARKTDAPERIWATGDTKNGSWTFEPVPEKWGACAAEYIRADIFAAKDAEIARLRDAICHAHDTLYELNPCNYDHDEVCRVNDASVEVILSLAPLLGETHGKTPEWWAARAALSEETP